MDTSQATPTARERRLAKRGRSLHAKQALAPMFVETSITYAEAIRQVNAGDAGHIGEYHGSSHSRISAPAVPTGMNERFVGFELELIPHLPHSIRVASTYKWGVSQFFGRMQQLASKALPGYWSKVEGDGTVPHGAEFISGYGPLAGHHVAMMPVLCDPVFAKLGNYAQCSYGGQSKGTGEPVNCGNVACRVCNDQPVAALPEGAKIGTPTARTNGCGLHVHVHATDRLGRRLSAADRSCVAEGIWCVMADLNERRTEGGDEEGSDTAEALWDALIGRESTDFCKPGAGGHYEAVNYDADRTPTIEVRIFCATTSPRLFFARLEFALALYEFALDTCITGRLQTWPGFLHWLDEHAAEKGMAALIPNLLAVLHDYPLAGEEGDVTDEPMPWLADKNDNRSADAIGESFPPDDDDDDDDHWEDPDEDDNY